MSQIIFCIYQVRLYSPFSPDKMLGYMSMSNSIFNMEILNTNFLSFSYFFRLWTCKRNHKWLKHRKISAISIYIYIWANKQKTDSVSFPRFPITPWNFSNTSGVYINIGISGNTYILPSFLKRKKSFKNYTYNLLWLVFPVLPIYRRVNSLALLIIPLPRWLRNNPDEYG